LAKNSRAFAGFGVSMLIQQKSPVLRIPVVIAASLLRLAAEAGLCLARHPDPPLAI
jgi:hypothetical protein